MSYTFKTYKEIGVKVEKLTNPELTMHVGDITKTLSINPKETKSVLSLYEQYLRNSKLSNEIDFSSAGIRDYVQKTFFADSGNASFSQVEIDTFLQRGGFDILKDMVRHGTNPLSVEGRLLHHDLKYLGLDSKSADIVRQFEESGITLITTKNHKKFNVLLGDFLKKMKSQNLHKPTKIDLMGHGMANQFTDAYYLNNEIFMNPMQPFLRGKFKFSDKKTGELLTEQQDFETFVHEYLHFAHEKSLGTEQFRKLNRQSLFEYLLNKKHPELAGDIDFCGDAGFLLRYLKEDGGNPECLKNLLKEIKANRDTFVETKYSGKFMDMIEDAAKECEFVSSAIRPYATATPLELVAEGGMYKYMGRKLPSEVDELLKELGCPIL